MESVDDSLEGLRKKILELERKISAYGFNEKRGVETYKVSEIKRVLNKIPQKDAEVAMEDLRRLVETQRIFYSELYKRAGVTEIRVDTEMPERNLEEIERWLSGNRTIEKNSNKFSRVVMDVLAAVSRGKNAKTITKILMKAYKRDYDRYRVLDFLCLLCENFGAKVEKPLPGSLENAAMMVAALLLDIGAEKVQKIARARLSI